MSNTILAVIFALTAGLFYAIASVTQQRIAFQQSPELSLSFRLIKALAKKPLWLLGVLIDAGAYLFEALALGFGSLLLVGPLMVSGLLFSVPLAAFVEKQRIGRREIIPALMVTIGLATFLIVGNPTGNNSSAPVLGWVATGVAVAALVSLALLWGRRPSVPPNRRAFWFGLATGTIYGFTAVLTKSTVDLLDGGIVEVFTHWQLYVLVAVSIIGLIVNQSAFQAGHVAASLPVIAVANPALSAFLGVVLFGETIGAQGVLEWIVVLVAIAAAVLGTVALAQSPLVTHGSTHEET